METWDLLRQTWFVLIGVLFVGYSILDGFDLGIGALLPFLGRSRREKDMLIHAVGPFWDGNEVWLLTGGGALFAAFPQAYATVFSGFYLALMIVLFSLIFRAVSLEFRAQDPRRRRFWEGAFMAGSLLPALLFGVALGNVMVGVPLDGNMDYTGGIFTLLRPLPLAFGLLGLAAFLTQGAAFAALKTRGELRERSFSAIRTLLPRYEGLFLLALAVSAVYLPGGFRRPLAWLFTVLFAAALLFLHRAAREKRERSALLMSSLAFAALWGIVGAVHFPHLVRASRNEALSLTIYNASSSRLTLQVMLVIALIGMPLVIAYTVYAYRVFKGKIGLENSSAD